jgi:hypothetical protein
MKSANFEILRPRWPELAALGGFAEAYAHDDPASALVKLRLFAENLTKDMALRAAQRNVNERAAAHHQDVWEKFSLVMARL